jgi:tetratricopeptide (TPR) repeat protein
MVVKVNPLGKLLLLLIIFLIYSGFAFCKSGINQDKIYDSLMSCGSKFSKNESFDDAIKCYTEALKFKPEKKVLIESKLEKITTQKKAMVDSLLSLATELTNNEQYSKAINIYKNDLLKNNPLAIVGLKLCNSQIGVNNDTNKDNMFKYLFFISTFWAFVISIISLLIFKRMNKHQSENSDNQKMISDHVNNFKNAIVSITSLLKTIAKEEQIVTEFNKVKTNDLKSVSSIEEIFQNINQDLNGIESVAKQIEFDYLNKKEVLKKIEQEANVPENKLVEKYKETASELAKLKYELERKVTEWESIHNLDIQKFQIPEGIYINSNILVSAGPRKDIGNETELGEDAGGVFNTPSGTFFWILDGTSDSPGIIIDKEHLFSSRILAQLMNKNIKEQIIIEKYPNNLKDILLNAFSSSKKEIDEKINNSSSENYQKIISIIKSDNKPYCSTTVLLGFLSKQGVLSYFYLGDSNVLSYNDAGDNPIVNSKDKNDNPSRLFISIALDGDNLVFKTNQFEQKIVTYKKENIDRVIAFSDGIGTSEKSLLINPSLSLSKISMVNQLTFDDKTLIVLERVKN